MKKYPNIHTLALDNKTFFTEMEREIDNTISLNKHTALYSENKKLYSLKSIPVEISMSEPVQELITKTFKMEK